jgi:bile acid-coenzyme A ligase
VNHGGQSGKTIPASIASAPIMTAPPADSSAPMPMASMPAHFAAQTPADPAVTFEGATLSWSQLDLRTNQLARALQSQGVVEGDLVTIALPNSFEFIEACFACWKLGATPQPVSSRLPIAELRGIVDLACPRLVISLESLTLGVPVLSGDALDADDFDKGPLPEIVSASWKAPTSGGSTGRPKLILATQPAVVPPAAIAGWRLGRSDIALMPGPLYHNGPFVSAFAALFAGAHLVLMPRFDAEAVLETVDRERATWLYLVPTMMGRIWRLPAATRDKYNLSSLRTVWHLAAPCPAWLKAAWIEWLGPDVIWELYAATEGMAGTVINGREWLDHRGSVGRVFTGQIKIIDEEGREAAPGQVGEVFMRTNENAQPSYRYVGAEARNLDGWESLGDLGSMDAEGYLYLADRRSDMILVGGSNVYPAEVEAALEAHPEVQSCAVIGLPDDDLGSRVHAIIQARPDLDLDELRRFLAERLVSYKRPKTFEIAASPLRDEAGKVRRPQLRAERLGA